MGISIGLLTLAVLEYRILEIQNMIPATQLQYTHPTSDDTNHELKATLVSSDEHQSAVY